MEQGINAEPETGLLISMGIEASNDEEGWYE
jgi:hypothetical protein